MIGDYQYDSIQSGNSSVLYAFNVASNADSFWSLVGTNGLFPSLADLAISVSRPDLIEGNFSFISHNGDSYTGNFSAIPYWQPDLIKCFDTPHESSNERLKLAVLKKSEAQLKRDFFSI